MSEEVKNTDYVLEVENLHTCFHTESGDVNAVNGLSMTLEAGKTLGIVGESGSGKSVTAYSIMQILAETGEITEGSVKYKGEDITKWSERELHNFRGSKCSIIFQDPMTSLNPVFTVGSQLREAIELHTSRKGKEDAIKKLGTVARDENNSITHDFVGKYGSAEMLLKRAPEGTGVIAGGPARAVIELAGIKNIRTKCMGSRNKQNVVLATIEGLRQLKTPEEVARLRGKSVDEILA